MTAKPGNTRPKPLPVAASMALSEGKLITAIKAVRDSENCDLATAKARIEAVLAADPQAKMKLEQVRKEWRKSLVTWVILIDVVIFAVFAWWFFGRNL